MYVSGKCNTFLIFFLFFKTMANTSGRQYQRHIHNNVYLCNRVILKCWFHVAQFKLNSGAGVVPLSTQRGRNCYMFPSLPSHHELLQAAV